MSFSLPSILLSSHPSLPPPFTASTSLFISHSITILTTLEYLFSQQQNQTKRLDDFPRLNWPMPPEEIGDPECSALKAAWEPLLTQDFALLVFDKKKLSLGQDGCVGVVADLIAQLPGPYARQHSDFLLRYVLINYYMLLSVHVCPSIHPFIYRFL